MLIGRDEERHRLRAALADARRGRGRAIVVRGEPGMGRTSLLRDLVAAANGFRTLTALGVESESGLAYAGLSDLLRPVVGRVNGLPGAQATALRAALAMGPPGVPDRFAAYAAALGLLGTLAADGPVLIAVDDAHLLDVASQESLLFCARRLGRDQVLMIATSHEAPVEGLDLTGVEQMRLGPLDDDAARALLRRAGGPLPAPVAEAVLAAAGGDPLALVELPRGLSPAQRAGRVAPPRALRAGEALAQSYRGRLAGVPAGPRRAALLVAVSEDGALAPLVAALEAGGGGGHDLEEAEAAELVTLTQDTARMSHPLLRAVVLELAGPHERREAHRAIAMALDPRSAGEQRAWHLADAAVGPDEEAAAALERAADIAASRTGYAAAAGALERAAELSGDAEAAAARRLRAARMALAAGRLGVSMSLLDGAGGSGTAAAAEVAHLKGLLHLRAGNLAEAARELVAEGERIAASDPAAAAPVIADAVMAQSLTGDCRGALAIGQRAYQLAAGAGTMSASVLGYLGYALTLRGRAREARALGGEIDRLSQSIDPLSVQGQAIALSQVWRVWIGDFAHEGRRLADTVERARAGGALGFLAYPLAWGCDLEFRLGRWDRARVAGDEAVSLLVETAQETLVGYAMTALARIEAGIGRLDAARARARAALERGRAVGAGSTEVYVASVLAFGALGDRDPKGARDCLAPLAPTVTGVFGLTEPGVIPWQPDLIEAHARLGQTDEARRALATLSEQAHRTGGVWAQAVTHRCRGLIDDDIDRHFGEALALHARTPMPFERARTELAYGARLRRAGRRTEAREQLQRALAAFQEIGARPWERWAHEEIDASGVRLRSRRDGRASDELSPREIQVALAVAEGATNREAAARLFLSEKTIERHLGSVYRKLGLRSRSELARRFARAGAAGDDAAGR